MTRPFAIPAAIVIAGALIAGAIAINGRYSAQTAVNPACTPVDQNLGGCSIVNTVVLDHWTGAVQ